MKQKRPQNETKKKGIAGHLQTVRAKNEQRRLARNEPGACAVRSQIETKKEGISGHMQICAKKLTKTTSEK
jgi:hypothetical protein